MKTKIYTKDCRECGNEFRPRLTTSKYCGIKCYNLAQKITQKGKKNPNYKDGNRVNGINKLYAERHAELKKAKKIIRDKLLEITGGYVYCEKCLRTITPRWEIHHIIYRSEAPKHKNLHNPRNLIHLCIQCHNDFHTDKSRRNDIVQERKLWELFPEYLFTTYKS